jgi:hypothetical protein
MSSELSQNEALPPSWDAELILDFLHSPGFEKFDAWMNEELAALEARWPHAGSPQSHRAALMYGRLSKVTY